MSFISQQNRHTTPLHTFRALAVPINEAPTTINHHHHHHPHGIPPLFNPQIVVQFCRKTINMVLGDANPPPDNFSGGGHSPDPYDQDAYATQSAQSVDLSKMPQPIPVFGPLMGYTEGWARYKIANNAKLAQEVVGRQLQPKELERLSYYILEIESQKSNLAALGLSLGIWRAWATMQNYRYPFYQPKPDSVNLNKFLFIKGPMANYVRHSWRFTLYALFASQMGKAIGATVAQPVAAQKTRTDPELQEFVRDARAIREKKAEQVRQKWMENSRTRPDPHVPDTPPDGGAFGQYGRGRRMEPVQRSRPTDDYGSQTSSSSSEYDTSGFQPESQPPSRPSQQPTSSQSSGAWGFWGSGSSNGNDDDASPTGGMFQEEVEKSKSSGQSSWERLRRGAPPPAPTQRPPQRSQHPQREQRENSSPGDSWTFAGTDEEREAARRIAQREFDERLERERRGGFDEGKKW